MASLARVGGSWRELADMRCVYYRSAEQMPCVFSVASLQRHFSSFDHLSVFGPNAGIKIVGTKRFTDLIYSTTCQYLTVPSLALARDQILSRAAIKIFNRALIPVAKSWDIEPSTLSNWTVTILEDSLALQLKFPQGNNRDTLTLNTHQNTYHADLHEMAAALLGPQRSLTLKANQVLYLDCFDEVDIDKMAKQIPEGYTLDIPSNREKAMVNFHSKSVVHLDQASLTSYSNIRGRHLTPKDHLLTFCSPSELVLTAEKSVPFDNETYYVKEQEVYVFTPKSFLDHFTVYNDLKISGGGFKITGIAAYTSSFILEYAKNCEQWDKEVEADPKALWTTAQGLQKYVLKVINRILMPAGKCCQRIGQRLPIDISFKKDELTLFFNPSDERPFLTLSATSEKYVTQTSELVDALQGPHTTLRLHPGQVLHLKRSNVDELDHYNGKIPEGRLLLDCATYPDFCLAIYSKSPINAGKAPMTEYSFAQYAIVASKTEEVVTLSSSSGLEISLVKKKLGTEERKESKQEQS